MNLITQFESFIERLMERGFTRATRSQLQPVEIGKRLSRAMESQQQVGVDGVIVPNVYDVYLSREDYEHYEPARRSMARNLEAHLGRVARQHRYTMMARPVVRLDMDEQLTPGDVHVQPSMGDVDTSTRDQIQHTAILPKMDGPMNTGPLTPNLVLNGKTYAVLRSPTRVGRLADNDIVLDDKRVSRHHAEMLERGGRWMVRDTGSTNGTAVNGKIISESILKPGDRISLGGLEITWEQ
ncbi:MAG: FhaA domain-containing protein [Chloroflexota bacterium]